MATKQKSRGPAKSGGRGGSTSKGRGGSAKGRGGAAKGRGDQKASRLDIEPERIRDLWGIALIVLALLSGLGLYAQGSAGLVGVALVNIFRGLLGVFGLAVPVLIAARWTGRLTQNATLLRTATTRTTSASI